MTATMISFDAGVWRFHLRAAAIIRDGDFVLLHRIGDDKFWALPGGRVEVGETAEVALRREMREELGSEVQIGGLESVVENLYNYGERQQHGIELHFTVRLPEHSPLLEKQPFERIETGAGLNGESSAPIRLEFRWFPVGEIASLDLRPSFLSMQLGTPHRRALLTHIVHDDRTAPNVQAAR